MPYLSESSGFSGLLALTTTKQTRALSREDGCKLTRPLFILLFICVFSSAALGQPWLGSGDANDPYQIYDACDMQAIGADANFWDAHFELRSDIDLGIYTADEFNIIGYYIEWNNNKGFTGVFDGNGHIIYDFTYVSPGSGHIGIFGYVYGSNAEIKDVGLINSTVDGGTGDVVGSLIGSLRYGQVTNCWAVGGTVNGRWYVGGLIGSNSENVITCYADVDVSGEDAVGGLSGSNYGGGRIEDCYASGAVAGFYTVGGLVGTNSASISRCYAAGSVQNEYDPTVHGQAGGLVGSNFTGTISECFATGSVSGDYAGGGLVGRNVGNISNCYATGSAGGDKGGGLVGFNLKIVSNCYSLGSVWGDWDFVGGLVGENDGAIHGSYWDLDTSGRSNMCGGGSSSGSGCDDTKGKTTAEMQSESTFIGWGCDPVWTIDEGVDYPRLWWENLPGEVLSVQLADLLTGSGTEGDPYLIHTAEELCIIGLFGCERGKHFRLSEDVDLTGCGDGTFNIIGSDMLPFAGVFDGNGHVVYNFGYSSAEAHHIGFFGGIGGATAEVKNLGLVDPNVDVGTGSYVGLLAGTLRNGSVTGCYVDGGSVSGDGYVGGMVGLNDGGVMFDCFTRSNVSATGYYVGGLIGKNDSSNISESYSEGSVSGYKYVGGLVGYNTANVWDCYSGSDVHGNRTVGGLIGGNGYETISHCYACGRVSGGLNVGGFLGWDQSGSYAACFWDVNVNPDVDGIGNTTNPNVIGETTANMQTESTFTDAGWDFVGESANGTDDFWDICDGTNYPKLAWQILIAGDFNCPDGVDWSDLVVLCGEWLLELIPADVGPDGGDGIVNFMDWAIFADGWQTTHDIFDLAEFADQWLKTGSNDLIADIAPTPDGDGIVNMVDYTLLAENWMEGH